MSVVRPASTVVVLNPAAAGGRVGARRAAIEAQIRAALGAVTIVATERHGHATELARQAVLAGATTVLSLGGDGTHNEVVNGLLGAGPAPGSVTFGVLPAGTGGDFRRLLAGGRDLATSLRALAHARAAIIDAGVVRFRADGGEAAERFFLNVASFGIGGLVDRLVDGAPKVLGGKASFYLGTLRALVRYRPARVRLWIDAREVGEFSITNICVCNGRFAGGGMMFAPEARLGDGLFDVVILEATTLAQTFAVSRTIYDGRHLGAPSVTVLRGRTVRAETVTADPAWVDIDGEAPGGLPVEITLLPGALRLLDPWTDVV